MAEDIFLPGKFTDFNDPTQLFMLNELLLQMLDRLNQIDPGSIGLSLLTGDVAGKVIASKGAGNSPEWDASPSLTTATLTGLTASQPVGTDGSKVLVSTTSTPNWTVTNQLQAGSGGNTTTFNSSGTLTMEGDATVWDDLRITPGSFDRPGVADPDYVIYYPNGGGLGVYLPEFAKNDFASFTIQLPHSYKQGTDIYAHIHWTPRDRGNEENGALVGWKLDYSWANINGTFGDMQTLDLQDACDGTDHKHQMTPELAIDGHTASKSISSMLICNIRRTDTGTDDTWASTTSGQLPLLLEIDFHFEMDMIGSNEQSAK